MTALTPTSPTAPATLPIAQILICGAMVVTLSLGIRHGFGLWLQPITQAQEWTRQTFSLALAIQNLSYGLIGILTGMLADRYGATKVLLVGAVLYALGLVGMASADTPLLFALTSGLVIGAAQAGTNMALIYGVIGRQIAPERRSWAMGVTAAAGSFGQFLMMPLEGLLIIQLGWQNALLVLAAMALVILPLAYGLREPATALHSSSNTPGMPRQSVLQALREAIGYRSFQLLMGSYFVCGFQVAFIGVHMPSYLKDQGLSPAMASYALALIGLFNIFGCYMAGALGQRHAKRHILIFIYLARASVISLLLLLPSTTLTVCLFSVFMGFLWLSTVPPTNAAVAQIFGIRHLSMLGGFIFFGHQVGSFLGVWLGGALYDASGSYIVVWQIAIALSLLAAGLCLGVREDPIARPSITQGQAA